MEIRQKTALIFSGFSWLAIGSLLIYRGIRYLVDIFFSFATGSKPTSWLVAWIPGHEDFYHSVLIGLAVGGVLFGWVKGRYIFSKTVDRVASRIASLADPFPLKKMYALGYLTLMVVMSSLGMCFRFFPLALDLKGFLDMTIGTALLIGSAFYFKRAYNTNRYYSK